MESVTVWKINFVCGYGLLRQFAVARVQLRAIMAEQDRLRDEHIMREIAKFLESKGIEQRQHTYSADTKHNNYFNAQKGEDKSK